MGGKRASRRIQSSVSGENDEKVEMGRIRRLRGQPLCWFPTFRSEIRARRQKGFFKALGGQGKFRSLAGARQAEAHYFQGFVNMQISRLALGIEAPVVVDPIS